MNNRFHWFNGQDSRHHMMVKLPTSIDYHLTSSLARTAICTATETETETESTSKRRSSHYQEDLYNDDSNKKSTIVVKGRTKLCNDRVDHNKKMKIDEDDASSVSSSCSVSSKRRRGDAAAEEADAEEPTSNTQTSRTRPKIIAVDDYSRSFDEKCSTGGGASFSAPASTSTTSRKSVKFGKVFIRNYNRTIAYNPSCTSGVPIGLSWDYDPQQIEMPIEAYESYRDGHRRSRRQMLMPRDVRFDLLREFQVSMNDILRASDEIEKAQRMKMLSQPRRRTREVVDKIIKTTNRGFRTFAASRDKESF